MHKTDFDAFRTILDRQAEVFSKPKPADELVQSYWHALRDISITTMKDCADRHARHGKFFPKPFELRPREDKPPVVEDASSRAKFEAAVKFSVEGWEALRQSDPELYRRRLKEARLARLEVVTHESFTAYAEIRREAGECAAERLAAGMARW